ncbi:hypothetical protein bsdcttw_40220 [Anaerocolumna chitinilytica]|uniref:Uncharacterized protein n=1 Tax=Anaerocolumna chitinilytica TaxID=1727145 RepID=A0A7I8DUL6_9FIRM|nr:hypothetical protein bsdcttw_40220 [Anaerocolumna chitinilytica]
MTDLYDNYTWDFLVLQTFLLIAESNNVIIFIKNMVEINNYKNLIVKYMFFTQNTCSVIVHML